MKGQHLTKSKHWSKKRKIIAAICAVLILGCISFSVMAWLSYPKKPVVYRFEGASLELTLGGEGATLPLAPSVVYDLNDQRPFVTLSEDNVESYVFVIFHEKGTATRKLNPSGDNDTDYWIKTLEQARCWNYNVPDWQSKQVDGKNYDYTHVLYHHFKPGVATTDLSKGITVENGQVRLEVVKDLTISVNSALNKNDVSEAALKGDYPSVTFSAYAVQTLGITDTEAAADLSEDKKAELAWSYVEQAIANNEVKVIP